MAASKPDAPMHRPPAAIEFGPDLAPLVTSRANSRNGGIVGSALKRSLEELTRRYGAATPRRSLPSHGKRTISSPALMWVASWPESFLGEAGIAVTR